jgi:hypothetical protein
METKDQSLQTELILGTATPSPSATATATLPTDIRPKVVRPKRRVVSPASYEGPIDTALTMLAYAGVLGIAGILWYFGAGFTLTFLTTLAPRIGTMGAFAWLIPAIITAVELKLWPHASSVLTRWAVFLGVLAFDVGTSFAGFTSWAGGRTIPLFTGITFPTQGWPLWVTGAALGLLFAFGPERLTRYAISEIKALRAR